MKIARVSLTNHEATWFTRNVFKTIQYTEEQGQKRPELLERSGYLTLKKIEDQVKSMASDLDRTQASPEHKYEIFLSRKQKLVMQEMIDNTRKALEDTVIPEYKKRMEKEPEQYKAYYDDAVMKSGLLKAMSRKLK